MQPKLIISFEHLSEPDFLVAVETMGASLNGNVNFPGPWPAQVPSLAVLLAGVAAYQILYTAANNGDRVKIKARKAARVTLEGQFKKVAPYLEIVASGNLAVLASTGYELRQDIVKSISHDPPAAPQGLTLARGLLSGGLVLHAEADAGVDVYHVQIASGDPAVEANWSEGGTHKHCNDIGLNGLTPGKMYYVRIQAFNKNGFGPWATSAGITVV